ncbi:hypothetical protein CGCA056_v005771 [Colletotrichum aenigma]|uniref:uncharacterized protein n=1 Tax=Colletotrichum aenigma TaxID=1215731 RepID=UPI00187261F5|nr:uncharacterized protein CGCA056_v005771 [Colletotrichum aenigma]KAF5523407.1 hypothetical protein CGCA056_v005771 [Colletotrichum aenigma]
MAADSGLCRATFAAQVCLTCKARKKKCDKLLPSCGYCGRKGLRCRYARRAPSPARKSKLAEAHCYSNSANVILTDIPSSESDLSARIQRLIRDTGQYLDGISVRYFEGFHQYLPFISRSRFEDSLIFSGVSPPAEFSVLLLKIFNTWWALVICERSIFCEVTVDEQPLVTLMPKDDSNLPVEIRHGSWTDVKTQCSVSSLSMNSIEGFGRVAQATWLVNKVLMAFKVSNTASHLSQLRDLDAISQEFLAQLLQQHPGSGGIMCEAVSIILRMLFKLHDHILHHIPKNCNGDEPVLETWRMQSRAALRAATKMVVEIAQAHENASSSAFSFFTIAPSYSYLFRVSLKNLHEQIEEGNCDWLESAEGRLRSELSRFET